MKKGDIFEGKVIRTEFPNKGIIDIEGQKVIVKNALEGQVVRFSINKKKRDKIEGRLLEVIEPSPIEQPAACKHFGICGGCRYQNLSYEQQLDLKKRQVEELIEKADFPLLSKIFMEARSQKATETRWNSHLVTKKKMVRLLLECIKKIVSMIS